MPVDTGTIWAVLPPYPGGEELDESSWMQCCNRVSDTSLNQDSPARQNRLGARNWELSSIGLSDIGIELGIVEGDLSLFWHQIRH